MAGYAQFTRPFFLFCFVFRGEMVTKLLFKTMTETVWHACWEYENMNIHTDTHKHHHNCSGHYTQTRPYTDLHFVEGLATKLPRETFNIEHPSTWPRHRERSTHWALQLLLAWNHELTAVTPVRHAHTDVWTPQALGRVLWWDQTVIGLVGSRQADSHLAASVAEAVVRLRPAGNTTVDQRSLPYRHARLLLCAHVHETKLSAGCRAARRSKRELPRACGRKNIRAEITPSLTWSHFMLPVASIFRHSV